MGAGAPRGGHTSHAPHSSQGGDWGRTGGRSPPHGQQGHNGRHGGRGGGAQSGLYGQANASMASASTTPTTLIHAPPPPNVPHQGQGTGTAPPVPFPALSPALVQYLFGQFQGFLTQQMAGMPAGLSGQPTQGQMGVGSAQEPPWDESSGVGTETGAQSPQSSVATGQASPGTGPSTAPNPASQGSTEEGELHSPEKDVCKKKAGGGSATPMDETATGPSQPGGKDA